MMGVFILMLVIAGLVGMIVRALLVVLGVYKDPVLRAFEMYGEEERLFSPLVSLALWCAALALFLLFISMNGTAIFIFMLLLAVPLSYFLPRLIRWVRARPDIFLFYPRWYNRLVAITEREERRRIAYLWLRLPLKTRLIYNTSDAYFQQWTDLVLMTIAR